MAVLYSSTYSWFWSESALCDDKLQHHLASFQLQVTVVTHRDNRLRKCLFHLTPTKAGKDVVKEIKEQ